ncbi:MAG TPA: hypothetical protein VK761_10390 [Solirubrobacteraceae bacterium]|jgi:hypothetical protein|nr:hypothetical protein [Solirubrobacteraceae bacterium]
MLTAPRNRYRVYTVEEFLADGLCEQPYPRPAPIAAGRSVRARGPRRASRLAGAAMLAVALGIVVGLVTASGWWSGAGARHRRVTRITAAVTRSLVRRSRPDDARTPSRPIHSAGLLASGGRLAHVATGAVEPRAPRRGAERPRSRPSAAQASERGASGEPAVRSALARAALRHPTLIAATTVATAPHRAPEFGFER